MVINVADELAAKLREGAASGEKVDMHEVEKTARRIVEAVRSMAGEVATRKDLEEWKARQKELARKVARERKAARCGG